MGILSALLPHIDSESLTGEGLVLRAPRLEDHAAWAQLRHDSRAFLEMWEPTWLPDELSASSYRNRVRRYRELRGDDQAYAYFIFSAQSGELLGGLTLSNVRRGVAMAATLGYWMGAAHAGKGHMTGAVKLLSPHAFGTLGLHRIEAACLPHNAASVRLLEKSGFEREGFAKAYLRIAGTWQDHLLFAKRAEP